MQMALKHDVKASPMAHRGDAPRARIVALTVVADRDIEDAEIGWLEPCRALS
ncbi:hypothetical protein OOZ63_24075 [Paucibacter sp. PLA-PC-4]|uniref:hypothetical protein n=1 Tax=Paucibacter sp. PLA-PC-4 TaxID=2993655 RepID=UPI00224AEB3F|nr:hypothetical protein [Paucibacter sp. PLA-PC-4]MCX2864913.1 hypothetical protein [Paucibacter sp. PLA-PC-4]